MEPSTHPACPENFDTTASRRHRPISLTPVLSRMTERTVVWRYIYPAFSSPPPSLQFADQFAFRPTGSTTAAMIVLLSTLADLLSSEPYVIVISLRRSVLYAIHHCSINSRSLTFQTIFTTGCPTSSSTTPTALYITISSHPCLTSLPVLFMDTPSDLPPMSLQQEISPPLFLEILYVNLLTILI